MIVVIVHFSILTVKISLFKVKVNIEEYFEYISNILRERKMLEREREEKRINIMHVPLAKHFAARNASGNIRGGK